MFFRRIIFLAAVVFVCRYSFAVERHRPFFSAARALAMGDAFTAYGQGFESVYYNPAGVARKGAASFKYIDFEIAGSYSVYSYIQDNLMTFYHLSQLANNLAARPDVVHSMSFSYAPQILTKNFSFGLLFKSYQEGLVDSSALNFDYFGTTDLALFLHYGVSFMGGVLKLGVGAKALDRAELNRIYTPAEYASGGLSFTTQWQEGIGYGLDAGVLLTAPVSGLPAFGIAVEDAGDTKLLDRRVLWTGSKGVPGAPPSLKQRVNTGVGFTVKHAAGVKSNIDFDFKDVLHASTGSKLERFHAGWEFEYERFLTLRAGVNQGVYWTAGLGLRLAGFSLELATWGENLYVYTGLTRAVRMYAGRYVLSF